MHKWPVRGIHEPDDSVVHIAGQVSAEIRSLEFVAKCGNARNLTGGFLAAAESRARRASIGHEHPDKTISLLTRVVSCVNAINLHILVRRQRWNQAALAALRLESPSVITALDLFAVKLSA